MAITFTNLTRGNEIGANCYFLELGDGGGVVLDAGVHPKLEGALSKPGLEWLDGRDLHGLLLSHCHLDHAGGVPLLAQRQPEIPIVMSVPSSHFIEKVLHNSVNIMTRQRDELQLPEYPFFTHSEVDRLAKTFLALPYERRFTLETLGEDVRISLHESGHIQGAAGILVETLDRSVFYTGDVNFRDQKITRRARFPVEPFDALIMETTRGAKSAPPGWSWESEQARLSRAIREVFDGGGSVLIPIFALGKTQELLFMLWEMMQRREIPESPVSIGGLGNSFTQIYDHLATKSPRLNAGFKFYERMDLQVLEHDRARNQPIGRGQLLLISAGMMTPQTSSYILGERLLEDPQHGMFFVGYCDPDSPAGRILAAPQGGEVRLVDEAAPLKRRCRVEHFDFSSHCNREEMMEYALEVKPKTVFLVHGDADAMAWFAGALKEQLPDSRVIIPEPGKPYEI